MLQVVYEDDRYKVLYGVAKKGCAAVARTLKYVAIDKEQGKEIHLNDLPDIVLTEAMFTTKKEV